MPPHSPDEIKIAPAYPIADVGRYVGISDSTLRDWFRGRKPIFPIEAGYASFIDLVAAHVLHTIRKGCRIPMKRVRRACETLKKLSGSLRNLAHKDFSYDKKNLFLTLDEYLISLSEDGQRVDREIISQGLKQLRFGRDEFADTFYPVGLHGAPQREFAINPKINFGSLHLVRLGIGVTAILDRFQAGEAVSDIAADYDAQSAEIEDAIRWHDRLAA